jgi:hypothetical protein
MFTGPIVMGNKHDQQISVIGLTKRPEQALLFAGVIKKIKKTTLRRQQCMHNIKYIFFIFFPMVIGSSKANANLSLLMVNGDNGSITEMQEYLLTGDSILLIGFLLWIAYIVFCMPKNTFKKL